MYYQHREIVNLRKPMHGRVWALYMVVVGTPHCRQDHLRCRGFLSACHCWKELLLARPLFFRGQVPQRQKVRPVQAQGTARDNYILSRDTVNSVHLVRGEG